MIIKFFHAEWCSPCRQFHPIIEKFANDNGIKFEDHDVESSDEVGKYKVKSVPTTIITSDDGQVLDHFTGLKSVIQLKSLINKLQ